MKIKSLIYVLVVILLLVTLVTLTLNMTGNLIINNNNNNSNQGTIKIGCILMLSGELASTGIAMQRGIDIAVDNINSNGGINGKQVEVIYEDSGFVNKTMIVNAANKLVNIDHVDVVLIDTINALEPIASIFQNNHVPIIALWDSTKFIENAGDYIFSIGFSTEKTGEKMGDFAYNDLGLKKVVIVKHQDNWAELISNSFENKFNELGGSIVLNESVPIEEDDFRTLVSKIKSTDADSIYLAFIPKNIDLFLKELTRQNVSLQVLGPDTFTDDLISASDGSANGVYFTNIYLEDNPILDNLINNYQNIYGSTPKLLIFNSFGYDGVLLLKEVFNNLKIVTPENIKDELYNIKDLKVSGGNTITINKNGVSDRIEKIYKVQEDGSLMKIK